MIIIPVTYETYDDEPETITQNCAFNISKREWMELQIADEPMADVIQKIIDSKSNQQIVEYLKEFVLISYGVRAMDPDTGKMSLFNKSDELRERFKNSGAFDKLIENMTMTNEDPIVEFLSNVLPKLITESPEFRKSVADVKAEVNKAIDPTAAVEAAASQPT